MLAIGLQSFFFANFLVWEWVARRHRCALCRRKCPFPLWGFGKATTCLACYDGPA